MQRLIAHGATLGQYCWTSDRQAKRTLVGCAPAGAAAARPKATTAREANLFMRMRLREKCGAETASQNSTSSSSTSSGSKRAAFVHSRIQGSARIRSRYPAQAASSATS